MKEMKTMQSQQYPVHLRGVSLQRGDGFHGHHGGGYLHNQKGICITRTLNYVYCGETLLAQ